MSLRRALPLRSLLVPLALSAALTGCGRSAGGEGGGTKANEALSTAQQARATATAASEGVDSLEGRVSAVEGTLGDHEAALGSLDERVVTLELGSGIGLVASNLSVDDPAAAGFASGDGVSTVEDGFASLNEKLSTQASRITSLEGQAGDLLTGALSPGLDSESLPADGTYATVELAVEDLYARVSGLQAGTDPGLLAFVEAQVAAHAQPYILGPTTVTSAGHVTDGTYSGLRGATGLCQAEFSAAPSAHLCSVEEAQRALSLGRYASTLADVTTWAMAPTLASSCDGHLSADPSANGTTLIVALDYAGAGGTGHVIHAGSATCDIEYPVLCCR